LRDLFPRAAADIASCRPDALVGDMNSSDIPEVPRSRVSYADGYGNLKTTIKRGDLDLPSGSIAWVSIEDVEREAYVSDGSFEVEEGKLALALGSSGWTDAAGEETVWMVLFLRGGSAWEEFGRPSVGSEVRIEA
jgi:S-adenosylmethionine hydrolase